MKILSTLMTVLFLTVLSNVSLAEERQYGSFIFSPDAPNALFFMDKIKVDDDFELRKALRNHEIDTFVLASPGGSVWAGLSMAGIIFDKELRVIIPKFADCASACSFMFFGGAERLSLGRLGVHQFSSSGNPQASPQKTQSASQFTVSEIIGFLNEFDTPRFVLERMFQDKDMYWFTDAEKNQLNSQDCTLDQARLGVIQQLYQSKRRHLSVLPATQAYASDAGHYCAPTAEIVQMAVTARALGAEAEATQADILANDAVEERYAPAVPSLVEWVYTLPEDQLTDEVAVSFEEACGANIN